MCSAIPSRYTGCEMSVLRQDSNSYILRLGDSGPAGLSQAEALDRLFSSASRGSELWFAINITNPGQLQKVSSRLIDEGWRFCASWNGVVRFVALARKVVTADDPQPVPASARKKPGRRTARSPEHGAGCNSIRNRSSRSIGLGATSSHGRMQFWIPQ